MSAAQEKRRRVTEKSSFSRSVTKLIKTFDAAASLSLVTEHFEKVKACYERLEAAHNEFLMATDIDIENEPDGLAYMNESDRKYEDMLERYALYQKTETHRQMTEEKALADQTSQHEKVAREQAELQERASAEAQRKVEVVRQFKSDEAHLSACIANFKVMALHVKDDLIGVSPLDRRSEWTKVETEFSSLKQQFSKLVSLEPSLDASEISKLFAEDGEKVFLDAQKIVLEALKDVSTTSGGVSSGTSPSLSSAKSTVRKEAVHLPKFVGDPKSSPFLNYPAWKLHWDKVITSYDEDFKVVMLHDHVDEHAKSKYIGYEDNYKECMDRLEKYYGDPVKVVSCSMEEVNSPGMIRDGDYKGLLKYSVVLESNYNRLKAMGYEHEMSNTSAMTSIMRKFPRNIAERWHDHLSTQEGPDKVKPFPILIKWLTSRKETWEQMSAISPSTSNALSNYIDGSKLPQRRTCFKCGEEGHVQRECPKDKTGGGSLNRGPKKRNSPTVKKFWCALHKGDPSKRCYSECCQDLRRTEVQKRLQLLKENGDCFHCCGDHKATDCQKATRVCGGGKADRGCTRSHQVHELFCADARVFAVQHTRSMTIHSKSEGVLLLIMQVKTLMRQPANVFWDGGSDSNFVRDAYAKKCGFKGTQVNLCVTTLGGVDKDFIEATLYTCFIIDVNGVKEEFEAYGMKSITGAVSKIGFETIVRLFPNLSHKFVNNLLRGDVVDFLIGMLHPSWHPDRAEKAGGGGDLWVYRGRFGSCIGGRHCEVKEETRKSENLFVKVNQVYHITAAHQEPTSHLLNFCPLRSIKYHFTPRSPADSNLITASVNTITTDVSSTHEIQSQCKNNVVIHDINTEAMNISEPSLSLISTAASYDSSVHSTCGNSHNSVDGRDVPSTVEELSIATSSSSSVISDPEDSVDGLNVPSTVSNNIINAVTSMPDVTALDGADHSPDVVPADAESSSDNVWCSNDIINAVMSTPDVTALDGADLSPDVVPVNAHSSDNVLCMATKATPFTNADLFFKSQSLGTLVEPQCGGCKCSNCPIPGMKYTFKEQQEYDHIQGKLVYCEERKRWFVEYPWAVDRNCLPKNEKAAYQWLLSLERMLSKNPELAEDYCQQIKDMLDRGAAVILTEKELKEWDKAYHYLPLLGVKGKKKWLRVVFDAARRMKGYPCINDCLMKGPDRFMNNLLGVLLGFRNGRVAAAADLSKFHNQVHLVKEDVHMQRFLWRDMKTDKPPKTLAVAVNNFGVKPANVIATSALHKSADIFAEKFPVASEAIKSQTYVDDELVAAENDASLREKTSQMDEICSYASMPNKGWVYSGDDTAVEVEIGGDKDTCQNKVLGMIWMPSSDAFVFNVLLKLLTSDGVVSVSSIEKLHELWEILLLTGRVLLSNVSGIFDPVGFLVSILLESKLLMREFWCTKGIGWDDVVPPDQSKRWLEFLSSLLLLNDVKFERSLWPDEEVVGLPMLIVFSDGSKLAFGAAAYIRWELKAGGYWSRLIMAKCRIAPKNMISIPRMELNGAVLGNRIKNFIMKETNLEFSKVYQLVDSSTVLGYVQKECGTFGPYEGVRVAEIQSDNLFIDGKLVGFAWVAGCDNPSDWCTKPRTVQEVRDSTFWSNGAKFLTQHESMWPIKFTYKKDNFEGELKVPKHVKCFLAQVHHDDFLGKLVNRSSSWSKAARVLSWILRYVDSRFVRRMGQLNAEELAQARAFLIKYAQRELLHDLQQANKGKYKKLCPVLGNDGIWRVGARMRVAPFTLNSKLPALLPYNHRVTYLLMLKAHQHSHLRQDGTVSRFRCSGFWTVRCGTLAKRIVDRCVTCRELDKRLLTQQMGDITEERLTSTFAWAYCQLDLWGPRDCRSDVNTRSSKKTWGIIIEDVNSGAVHLDIVQDYSAAAVILSLRRFGSLRGWPGIINTDPGSQLESAGGQFEAWWSAMGKSLQMFGGAHNFKWNLSPADSPWRQGKAERRIAIVKRCLAQALGEMRVTPVELQTVLFEIANICNERPIGVSRPRSDGSYSLITPNQLLLGRSMNILPDDSEIVDNMPMRARYRLVHEITSNFWKRWSSEVSPSLVIRQKWHEKSRNLCVGDLVRICEPSKLKANYKLGIVDAVTVSVDGSVRSAIIRYVLLQKKL